MVDEISNFESKRILVLVDSCYCGDFKIRLGALDGVSIITSNDIDHPSRYVRLFGFRWTKFAHHFFTDIIGDFNEGTDYTNYNDDYNSFIETRADFYWSYGLSSFRAWHSFFGP